MFVVYSHRFILTVLICKNDSVVITQLFLGCDTSVLVGVGKITSEMHLCDKLVVNTFKHNNALLRKEHLCSVEKSEMINK